MVTKGLAYNSPATSNQLLTYDISENQSINLQNQ